MRLPKASSALFGVFIAAYFHLSGGLLFIPDSAVNSLALASSSSPFNFVSHFFVHVGIVHLLGNLIPLLVFGIVFELSAPLSADVLAVFFSSGILASALFSLLNPGVALVGASAGVSGLIGAAVSVRPKISLSLLIVVPLLFNFLLLPWLSQISIQQQSRFFEEENELKREFSELVQQNRAEEAAAVNRELAVVSEKKQVVEKGVKREASTPADFFVHLVGVTVGVAYVFLFRRRQLAQGASEMRSSLSSLGVFKPRRKTKG